MIALKIMLRRGGQIQRNQSAYERLKTSIHEMHGIQSENEPFEMRLWSFIRKIPGGCCPSQRN